MNKEQVVNRKWATIFEKHGIDYTIENNRFCFDPQDIVDFLDELPASSEQEEKNYGE